jgi:hypothetical protein
MYGARICKCLSSRGIDLGIDSARQVGNRFLGSLKGLQIRAQYILASLVFIFKPIMPKLKTKFVCIIKMKMEKISKRYRLCCFL